MLKIYEKTSGSKKTKKLDFTETQKKTLTFNTSGSISLEFDLEKKMVSEML